MENKEKIKEKQKKYYKEWYNRNKIKISEKRKENYNKSKIEKTFIPDYELNNFVTTHKIKKK